MTGVQTCALPILSPKGGRKVHFLAQRRMQSEHLIEKVGKELRGMMSWMKK